MTTALCFIPFFKSKIGFPTNLIGKTNLQCGPRTRLVRDIILNINSFFVANSVAAWVKLARERSENCSFVFRYAYGRKCSVLQMYFVHYFSKPKNSSQYQDSTSH